MNNTENTPFHSGELAVQERLGVQSQMVPIGKKNIRDYMPEQHRQFFSQLPFILIGAMDGNMQPWASILMGNPGFAFSPQPKSLVINTSLLAYDPLLEVLKVGVSIGLLGIELPTRRRNRLNGIICSGYRSGFSVDVVQSFGNCPKYIQTRDFYHVGRQDTSPTLKVSQNLTASDRALILESDTFFIASGNTIDRSVDVSHRGGKVGFVKIDGDSMITVPDFFGNNFFNTLGNLQNHPLAGLLFIDFTNGDLLYVAADTEIIWQGVEVQSFVGAERLVRFYIREVRRITNSLPLRWQAPQLSPYLLPTGNWVQTL